MRRIVLAALIILPFLNLSTLTQGQDSDWKTRQEIKRNLESRKDHLNPTEDMMLRKLEAEDQAEDEKARDDFRNNGGVPVCAFLGFILIFAIVAGILLAREQQRRSQPARQTTTRSRPGVPKDFDITD